MASRGHKPQSNPGKRSWGSQRMPIAPQRQAARPISSRMVGPRTSGPAKRFINTACLKKFSNVEQTSARKVSEFNETLRQEANSRSGKSPINIYEMSLSKMKNIAPRWNSGSLPKSDRITRQLSQSLLEGTYKIENKLVSPDVSHHPLGLQNEAGENNCFLNVVVQALFNLPNFRKTFLEGVSTQHKCLYEKENNIGNCVCCSLADVLIRLRRCETGISNELTSVNGLRQALHKHSKKNLFKPGEMNDAAETYMELMELLHDSFKPGGKDEGCDCCIHNYFGMAVKSRSNCSTCGGAKMEHNFNEWSFTLNVLIMSEHLQRNKDFTAEMLIKSTQGQVDAGYCGKCKCDTHSFKFLTSPNMTTFTLAPVWSSGVSDQLTVKKAVDAFAAELDIQRVYSWENAKTVPAKTKGVLSGLFCHYGRHYVAFSLDDEGKWKYMNDTRVTPVGDWEAVKQMLVKNVFQPLLLFYKMEAVEGHSSIRSYASMATAMSSGTQQVYDSHQNKWIDNEVEVDERGVHVYGKNTGKAVKSKPSVISKPRAKPLPSLRNFTSDAKDVVRRNPTAITKRFVKYIADNYTPKELMVDEKFIASLVSQSKKNPTLVEGFFEMVEDEDLIYSVKNKDKPIAFFGKCLMNHFKRIRR
eukprot:TRINITY_DN1247_c0_g2_i1.p1 TRINITY_DN1247_c0_g2~~TRINITY_DN1247_c0_g2_i1.p1  ORF type:complete len:662 (-),score=138.78 TRINITY_DN1247_c0_g2_i1:139-2058(-)